MRSRSSALVLAGLIVLAGLAFMFAPAEAQQVGRVPTVGLLSPHPLPTPEQQAQTLREPHQRLRGAPLIFLAKLRELGWIDGQNVRIEFAYGGGREDHLPKLAAELVHKRVDVIWAHGTEAAVAAARATTTIPIVFFGVSIPVEIGLVDSLGRPGRNVTGVAYLATVEQRAKQLEFLREIAPGATRLAWITTPTIGDTVGEYPATATAIDLAAHRLGFAIQRHNVYTTQDLDAAFAAILESRAEALALHGTTMTFRERERIANFAKHNRLPSAFLGRGYADAGGLLAWSPPDRESILLSAAYTDRILRGARPAELPVEQPSKVDLVINLKTAKALGLTIPPSLLLRADQVIE
jgi:putative tryptophan/tyrosine transport system substrate-binding protein